MCHGIGAGSRYPGDTRNVLIDFLAKLPQEEGPVVLRSPFLLILRDEGIDSQDRAIWQDERAARITR
jgi:hypothetical protein